jgi:hypothetical protein
VAAGRGSRAWRCWRLGRRRDDYSDEDRTITTRDDESKAPAMEEVEVEEEVRGGEHRQTPEADILEYRRVKGVATRWLVLLGLFLLSS